MQTPETPAKSTFWASLIQDGVPATGEDWNPIRQRALLVNRLAILLALAANLATMGSFFLIGDAVPLRSLGLMLVSTVL